MTLPSPSTFQLQSSSSSFGVVTQSLSPTFQLESSSSSFDIVMSSPSVSPSPSPVISELERVNAIIVTLSGLTEANVGYEEQLKHNLFRS